MPYTPLSRHPSPAAGPEARPDSGPLTLQPQQMQEPTYHHTVSGEMLTTLFPVWWGHVCSWSQCRAAGRADSQKHCSRHRPERQQSPVDGPKQGPWRGGTAAGDAVVQALSVCQRAWVSADDKARRRSMGVHAGQQAAKVVCVHGKGRRCVQMVREGRTRV